MLTDEQQAMWREQEQRMLAGIVARLAELVRNCEKMNPLIENAIGGLENANRAVITYHMTLGEARVDLKLLQEHREMFKAALERPSK